MPGLQIICDHRTDQLMSNGVLFMRGKLTFANLGTEIYLMSSELTSRCQLKLYYTVCLIQNDLFAGRRHIKSDTTLQYFKPGVSYSVVCLLQSVFS